MGLHGQQVSLTHVSDAHSWFTSTINQYQPISTTREIQPQKWIEIGLENFTALRGHNKWCSCVHTRRGKICSSMCVDSLWLSKRTYHWKFWQSQIWRVLTLSRKSPSSRLRMRLGLKDLFGCPHSLTAGLSRGRRVESAALVTILRDSRSFPPVWGSLEVFEGQCPVDLL